MAGTEVRSTVLTVGLIALVVVGIYLIDPNMCGLLQSREGFDASGGPVLGATPTSAAGPMDSPMKKVVAGGHSAGGDMKPSQPELQMKKMLAGLNAMKDSSGAEAFANMEDVTGPAQFGAAAAPAGCYPRDQLTPTELLPKDGNSVWAQQNPMGTGSLKGKNFLSAGALIGVNTVGQTLRNANYQLRSEPANPQVPVSVFYNSTIEPDTNRRDLEIE